MMRMCGNEAEERACRYLKACGYRILSRNWRSRQGEVDIIARDGNTVSFVEVKARSTDAFGGPEAAVDLTKQRRIVLAAMSFVETTACELPMRFDVVAIRPGSVQLYRDAFQVPG